MIVRVTLDPKSIENAIKKLDDYKNKLPQKADQIAKALADVGYQVAVSIIGGHVFSGETLSNLKVEKVEDGKYTLSTQSKAILFFEFGAGVKHGGGHPWDAELGFGPGTYPGQKNADNPNGWWFRTDDPSLIVKTITTKDGEQITLGHTYGNPPYMPFYSASQAIEREILRVAKEVLQS